MNPMYYILIGVIFLVVAIDFYVKNKKKKSDSTDIDFPEKKEKSSNVLIITICSLLVVLIIGFFVADKNIYEGELTNSDDGISLIDNIIYQKLTMEDLIKQDSIWIHKKDMNPVSCIVRENGENIGLIKNGFKEGLWQERYENGQLKNRWSYNKGLFDYKFFESWFENGQLSEKILKESHPKYKPKINFETPPDYLKLIFHIDGTIKSIHPLVLINSKYLLHGVSIDFRQNIQHVSYNDVEYSGPAKIYNDDGLCILEYIPNDENYYEPLNKKSLTITGKINEWHDNGVLKSEFFVKGDVERPDGSYIEWNDNGKVIKDGEYVNGKFISKRKPKRKKPRKKIPLKIKPNFSKSDYVNMINKDLDDLVSTYYPKIDEFWYDGYGSTLYKYVWDVDVRLEKINNNLNLVIDQYVIHDINRVQDYHSMGRTLVPLNKIKSIDYNWSEGRHEISTTGDDISWFWVKQHTDIPENISKRSFSREPITDAITSATLGSIKYPDVNLTSASKYKLYEIYKELKNLLNDHYFIKFDDNVPLSIMKN